ncbi:MAG: Carboxy-terminal domain (CTD) phosphatase [Peltula sp. TS41687]|nr:MAG: Carboxy-terminal domain (CTD) phosphatase [Peltula sp. TS41687]
MRLQLPRSLHYPITITELLRQPGDAVERLAPLFSYAYKTTVTEGDAFGEERQVEKTFPTRYESPVEGVLKAWKIEPGAVITSQRSVAPLRQLEVCEGGSRSSADCRESYSVEVAEIEEPCPHSVQFAGMCTMCGKDMTASVSPPLIGFTVLGLLTIEACSRLSYNTDISNAERATINMIHNNTALTISQDEASRVEEEAKRRLLKSRKLSLVVDLDQTIIHATVDPTVAEWQQDRNNPNHEAVKFVRAFQLVDDGPGARGCWYYIKLRPGLKEFLEKVSKLYELHIYTMGTRAYAQNIANIVDPDRKIFGDRILSRDESGSLTAKSLQRLFPVDTKMVVIIDDRGDVWQWSHNLIKVAAYDFFVGIGDINASFLPRRPELQQGPRILRLTMPRRKDDQVEAGGGEATEEGSKSSEEATDDPSSSSSQDPPSLPTAPTANKVSTLDHLVSMSGGDDPTALQQQASRQDEALAAQLEDRPLLQKQKLLDAEDEAAAASSDAAGPKDDDSSSSSDELPSEPYRRQNLLHDDDTELKYLEQSLQDVHRAFFEEYDKRQTRARGGRLAELRQGKKARKLPVREDDEVDLEVVPDVKEIMPQMKMRVLEGVVLVFSGVVPLGTDIQRADIAIWAKSFGAQVAEKISKRTTHVIAGRNRTNKVRQAARRPYISIVSTHWLLDCISQWQWLEEEPYLIPIDPEDREPQSSSSTVRDSLNQGGIDDGTVLSSESDEEMAPLTDEDMERVEETDDPEGVRPAELEDHESPVDGFENYAWGEVDSELAEFLGSDDGEGGDDTDEESVLSESSATEHGGGGGGGKKRKRSRSRSATPSSEAADGTATTHDNNNNNKGNESDERGGSSRLAKRQQMARERTTGLKTITSVAENASSLPTPDVAAGEDGGGDESGVKSTVAEVGADDEVGDDDDDDDQLQRELEAEMEREMDGTDDDAG